MRKEKGITLVALVVTIIILILLAGITIRLTLGENGILNYSKEAKEETNKETATEKINLKITNAQMESYAKKERMPTLKEVSLVLKEDEEVEYVTETKQIASTKYEVGEEPTFIYTKLKDYPYEFGINSSLQLASVNGENVQNDKIDYSNPQNEVVLTKNVQVSSRDSKWAVTDIEGPELEAGTWLIFMYIQDLTDTSAHQTLLMGTGCSSNIVPENSWAGTNHTFGYYKGEKTKLKVQIYNGSDTTREYTLTVNALKLSDTY